MWNSNDYNIFLVLMTTFVVSVVLVPIIKRIAIHVNAIDLPDKRKVHQKPIPRMGGLAVFLAFLTGYLLFADKTETMNAILIGSFIIVLLGILDDIKSIKARYKIIVHIIAASVVVFYAQIFLSHISAFGITINFGLFGYPLAILFIVAIINAINFIDGIDGLSSGIGAIYFTTIAIIALALNHLGGLDIMLCLLMLGATLGFLVYNFPPASIFQGDTGSTFLGFMIAVIALLGFKGPALTSLIIPVAVLFLPILDTIFAILRRIIKGENIAKPDKEHIHHQLLKLNKSPRKTVLIMYSITILCAGISLFYAFGDSQLAILLYVILLMIIIFLILNTNILFKQTKKSRK